MQKSILILGILAAMAVAGYFALRIDIKKTGDRTDSQYATFSGYELGFSFKYPTGPNGYVIEDPAPKDRDDAAGLLRTLVLIRNEDMVRGMPVGGEGSPTITIQVFSNTKKQQPRAWADTHMQYSNINLKIGDVTNLQVGAGNILENPNAIRYMVDGLYRTDTIVAAHGEYIYVIGGSYLDEDSDLRRDFKPFVDSIVFASQSAQK